MLRARAIILNEQGEVLLGKNQSDEWMVPGGGIKPGEHPVDAVLRECDEETGYDFDTLEFLWFFLDNYVFMGTPTNLTQKPTVLKDPCCEFNELKWFDFSRLPGELDDYAEDILYRFLRKEVLPSGNEKVEAGHIDVLVDGEKVYELEDDTIWLTLPKLAQERSKGRKIEFKQIMDDGTVLDQTPNPMPVSADLGGIKINKLVDELFNEHIPEEKMRPLIEVVSEASFLAKTVWRKRDGLPPIITIIVNSNVLEDDKILRQVLAHEIIHAHLYEKYGQEVARHGEHFDWYAQKINSKEGENYVSQFADHTDFENLSKENN